MGGETRGGHRERGFGCEIYTYGGRGFFHSFSQTGKVVGELLEFKYLYLLTLMELNWENINSRRSG